MKRNKLVRFGGIALAAAVLVTGTWYTGQETDDLSIPQIVEYVDTEDGSIVIPEEEVPLATKPIVKVKKTTRRKVKKSRLKKKAKKTAKRTKRSKKSKTIKKENSKKKVATATTVLTTVVSATKKNSKVKTVTTTVETTVKTTTTNKPKRSSSEAAASANTVTANTAASAAQSTSSDEMQIVSNVTVRSMTPRADANVLNAFENLEFKIEINPTSSYSGYFSVKAHNIILKKSSGDTIYHELGHFVGWLAGNVDTSSEFVAIYNKEKSALQSANYQYLTKSSAEYFAESYKDYVLSPQNLQSSRPQTYEFVKNAVSRITDARVTNIKSAYMKAYWT
ncbi:Uncharacterised protein [uncultured Clostridium sp.]|uniref:ATLF-like domain-containing protein n=1 Tax=Muricoprocola aceti TaxID=2981772 RepID=A0ABT2SKE9_9FIRM|nr:hypothetical protein [Muricoprocola aceti]MCU6724548.1 hypothetical protein [Muricoprocola aceti]SCH17872.1 Uncharacterised protein [uncultured Clostridium sp.]